MIEPKSSSGGVTCCLITVPRLEAPEFEALSYTWGNEMPRHHIRCRDGPSMLCVTETCASALRRLQYSDRERVLWIDAICINQDDTEERNIQVRHMPHIYSSCVRVVVDLGEGTEDSDLAMLFISSENFQHIGTTVRLAVATILRRSWFERVWVI